MSERTRFGGVYWRLSGLAMGVLFFAQAPLFAVEPKATPTEPQTVQNDVGGSATIESQSTKKGITRVLPVSREPARVRMGLRMVAYEPVTVRGNTGKITTSYVARRPMQNTLRARVETTNHFYIGDWHVETVPTALVKETKRYEVQLNFYRRFGDQGEVEEKIGSMLLPGFLDEQDRRANLFVLRGYGQTSLRDKEGHPILDVVAGYRPEAAPPAVSQDVARPTVTPQGTTDANTGAPRRL